MSEEFNSWVPLFCDLIGTSDLHINGHRSEALCVGFSVIVSLCPYFRPPSQCTGWGFANPSFVWTHHSLMLDFPNVVHQRENGREERGELLAPCINCSYSHHLKSNSSLCPKSFSSSQWFVIVVVDIG